MKKNKLPKWNLDEIYVGHNDPKIDKDLKKLSKLTNQFIDKWKGKIKNLSGKEISNCLKEYEKINEIMGLLSTHSSLSFASNMVPEVPSTASFLISKEFIPFLLRLIRFNFIACLTVSHQ